MVADCFKQLHGVLVVPDRFGRERLKDAERLVAVHQRQRGRRRETGQPVAAETCPVGPKFPVDPDLTALECLPRQTLSYLTFEPADECRIGTVHMEESKRVVIRARDDKCRGGKRKYLAYPVGNE